MNGPTSPRALPGATLRPPRWGYEQDAFGEHPLSPRCQDEKGPADAAPRRPKTIPGAQLSRSTRYRAGESPQGMTYCSFGREPEDKTNGTEMEPPQGGDTRTLVGEQ